MAECISPFTRKLTKSGEHVTVPCGKCGNCKSTKVSAWSFRIMQESRACDSALFLTLTYDNEHIPLTKSNFLTLRPEDLQLFIKRLRKYEKIRSDKENRKKGIKTPFRSRIRYYAVGEYGGKTKRPHYHIILFNSSPMDCERGWTLDGKRIGEIHVGRLSEASSRYTLKYVSKPGLVPVHKNDDRVPEFSRMSRNLGKNYVTEKIIKWHRADLFERVYLPLEDGKKAAMPRFYKQLIYTKREQNLISAYFRELKKQEPFEDPMEELSRKQEIIRKLQKDSRKTSL